jgi:hypothetical protein
LTGHPRSHVAAAVSDDLYIELSHLFIDAHQSERGKHQGYNKEAKSSEIQHMKTHLPLKRKILATVKDSAISDPKIPIGQIRASATLMLAEEKALKIIFDPDGNFKQSFLRTAPQFKLALRNSQNVQTIKTDLNHGSLWQCKRNEKLY